ncbi:MAG: ATP-binding cassette domain-containing protein [Chloroflexi bacterium]|nr:ATP-binding cassette domain-containing protein [Chloroflexota bacterium]
MASLIKRCSLRPDIVLRRGEVAALIGPNGVGKSTFVKTTIGRTAPLDGEVKIGASVNCRLFRPGARITIETNSMLDDPARQTDEPEPGA